MSQSAQSCVSAVRVNYSSVIQFASSRHPARLTLPFTTMRHQLTRLIVAGVCATAVVSYACGLPRVSSKLFVLAWVSPTPEAYYPLSTSYPLCDPHSLEATFCTHTK